MSETEWDDDNKVEATEGHWEVDPTRVVLVIVGFFVTVLAFIVACAWVVIDNNRTDAESERLDREVDMHIVSECLDEGREFPLPPTCVEQIREAVD